MLCKTCEEIISNDLTKCPKCGNNPNILNQYYVDVDSIEKWRPYMQILGVTTQLGHIAFLYLLYNAITMPTWLTVSLLISTFLHIALYRFVFIKPIEMRWVFMAVYLPALPSFIYRKISERAEAILFLSIGAVWIGAFVVGLIMR